MDCDSGDQVHDALASIRESRAGHRAPFQTATVRISGACATTGLQLAGEIDSNIRFVGNGSASISGGVALTGWRQLDARHNL